MTFSAALLLLAPVVASNAAGAGAAHSQSSSARPAPVAVVVARAEIVRPVSVRIRRNGAEIEIEAPKARKPQAEHDRSGTLWVEFS